VTDAPSATGGLYSELQRRHVFGTLALYIPGTRGRLQGADVLLPALDLPESAIRYLLYAGLAGLRRAFELDPDYTRPILEYDAIRNTPTFMALRDELVQQGWLDPEP
jgi:hypothetical protein